MKHDLKTLLILTLALKAAILLGMALGPLFFPFQEGNYAANFLDMPGNAPDLWSRFKTWDAQIYLHLARVGYSHGGFDDAFYPLFPFLVRMVGTCLGGNYFLAGLVLSNFLTLGVVALFYRWAVGKRGGEPFYGPILLLAFPTAFYLGMIYSEALFLFLALGLFIGLEEKKTVWICLAAFFLPLTRPTGVLVAVPLMVAFWTVRDRRALLGGLSLGAGFLAYLGVMRWATGNAFSGFEAQAYGVGHYAVANLAHPLDWLVRNFIRIDLSWTDPGTSVLDRFFFLGYAMSLWMARKGLNAVEWSYCLVLGGVPALSGDLMSYSRYLLALFPIFHWWALRCRGREWAFWIPGSALQTVLALRHSLNYFVS